MSDRERRSRELRNARARRHRALVSRGEAAFRVRVKVAPVLSALLQSTLLSESEALDRAKVEKALADVVAEWARRWTA